MPRQKGDGRGRLGGKAKGYRAPATLAKEAARELVRETITRELRPLIEAAVANAKGLKYLVVRHRKTGKFLRVTEGMARRRLGKDEELIEVWEKDPSAQALKELLDRALDKAAEQPATIDHAGEIVLRWGSRDEDE